MQEAKFANRGHSALLKKAGCRPLELREALNKVAHADPETAGFVLNPRDEDIHDLLLFGDNRGERWFAAVSLTKVVTAVRALPDRVMEATEPADDPREEA
jgi:hypothetical protein